MKFMQILLLVIAFASSISAYAQQSDKETQQRYNKIQENFRKYLEKGKPNDISQEDWYTLLQAYSLLDNYADDVKRLKNNIEAYRKSQK